MKWTATNAAKEFGKSRETILRALRAAGHQTDRHKEYTTAEIHAALSGDLKYERTREARNRADLLEIEKRQKLRESFSAEDTIRLINESFGPIRQRFISLPTLAPRVNPTDPAFAKAALERERDEAIKDCREKILAIPTTDDKTGPDQTTDSESA